MKEETFDTTFSEALPLALPVYTVSINQWVNVNIFKGKIRVL